MKISQMIKQSRIDPREAELLVCRVTKKDPVYIRIHDDELSAREIKKIQSLIKRRQKHEPIAYLVGYQPFMGHDFFVDKNTLIPRPETERLAELVIEYLKRKKPSGLIMDIGTGSGCLAITLALKFPNSKVIASDVSSEALAVARRNAKILKAKVEFVKQNLLTNFFAKEQITLVANLPYLPLGDKKQMKPDVVKYEPAQALFAGKDGTDLVKKLLAQASALNVEAIFLEIDPQQSTQLQKFAKKLFPSKKVQIKKDLCSKNRFITVS